MTIEETQNAIEVMQHYVNGGAIEYTYTSGSWYVTDDPLWDWYCEEYRKAGFKYPMWFKCTNTDLVVKFTGLKKGVAVVPNASCSVGYSSKYWPAHTDRSEWQQIPEPCLELTLEEIAERLGVSKVKIKESK